MDGRIKLDVTQEGKILKIVITPKENDELSEVMEDILRVLTSGQINLHEMRKRHPKNMRVFKKISEIIEKSGGIEVWLSWEPKKPPVINCTAKL